MSSKGFRFCGGRDHLGGCEGPRNCIQGQKGTFNLVLQATSCRSHTEALKSHFEPRKGEFVGSQLVTRQLTEVPTDEMAGCIS